MPRTEFAIGFENATVQQFVEAARLVEELGFSTFWIPEDYFYRGAFTIAAAIASATTSLKIGIGVLNPFTRHPALIAMEFAALDELAQGRAILGIGAGVRAWIEINLRLDYKGASRAIRESVEVIRAMMRGDKVDYEGRHVRTSGVKLNFSPLRKEIPIHLGVLGPRNLALAGEIADGVLLSAMLSPAYIRFAREAIARGRGPRGASDFPVAGYILSSIGEDDRAARDAIKPLLAGLIGLMAGEPKNPLFATAGLDPDLVVAIGARLANGEMPVEMISDWIVDTFAIAGSPERCRENLARLFDAGLTSPVFFEIPGVPHQRTIGDVHRHLLSRLL
ncbi:MAG TPA: LLM class flavin-dependent oxidoreductase [Candidatus Binataceae bacterium]|nr:LLM class flavin-dependent oxidoreductase [Candidatus Binataceae bacterium]